MFFTFIHSILGWSTLALTLISIILAILHRNNDFTKKDKLLFTITMSVVHLQLIVGFVVYALSSKVAFSGEMIKHAILRFFTMEHPLLMILGIVLLTIGTMKSSRSKDSKSKFKFIYVFYSIALLLFLARIPWEYLSVIKF